MSVTESNTNFILCSQFEHNCLLHYRIMEPNEEEGVHQYVRRRE